MSLLFDSVEHKDTYLYRWFIFTDKFIAISIITKKVYIAPLVLYIIHTRKLYKKIKLNPHSIWPEYPKKHPLMRKIVYHSISYDRCRKCTILKQNDPFWHQSTYFSKHECLKDTFFTGIVGTRIS